MTVPVNRRSFVYFLADIIPNYKLFPSHKFMWSINRERLSRASNILTEPR